MRPVPARGLVGVALAVAVLVTAVAVLAVGTPLRSAPPEEPPPTATASDPTAANGTGLQRLHESGVTGANVTVGVVDVTGFDVDSRALTNRVVATRAFAPGETVANGGRNGHGTAAAAVVARTAPDSDLYLATFDTADGYRRAVAWLVREDVDVVVAPVSFYGKADDGTSRVARIARRATERGVAFVAPVGNLGRNHWSGRYRPVGDGVHRFEGGTRNYLRPSNRSRFRLWLSWDDAHRSEDYTAELYWTNGTARRLVARSQPFGLDRTPNERIVARLRNGSYYVRITGPPNATGARLTVESPTHGLQFRSRSGSVTAPAAASGVLAVGTYDRTADRVAPGSSAGPTVDGRVGVDVVAPDGFAVASRPDGFDGSSAAAAYAGGTVALVLDAGGDRPPARVERVLERSAADLRRPGPDTVSGYGRLRPAAAVRLVRNRSNAD